MTYDEVVLSPHLDDAVLSAGGRIFTAVRAGRRVLVVTVFAGDPPPGAALSDIARKLHDSWGLDAGAPASRRAEDRAAVARLGAEAVHLDFPECLYRADPASGAALYPSFAAIFAGVHAADAALAAAVARRLRELPAHGRLLAPLALGGHVDHQVVRAAAEELGGCDLAYYEDFPYARRWRAVARATRPRAAWTPEVVALDEAALRAKCESARAYVSQIGTLFGGVDKLEKRTRGYARKVGGERVWRRTAAR